MHYIDGTWRGAAGAATRASINPFDQSVLDTVAEGDRADAQEAVAAARRAFDTGPWRQTTASARGRLVTALGQLVAEHADELARIETLDTGKPLRDSEQDMADIAGVFRYYGELADKDAGREIPAPAAGITSRVLREPVGVCGLICPWNYPLLQLSWKLAPALAAGNTVVAKPSELTPLSTLRLFELMTALDLPPGVANLVLGPGPQVGAELARSPGVDLVSFTGGIETGRQIMRAAAGNVKKIALELGGKNPNIIFADAALDTALDYALTAAFLHSGQVCSAGARLLVEEGRYDEVVAWLAAAVPAIRLGSGLDPEAETGPLVSAEHRAKVEAYIRLGVEEGARLVCGGRRPDDPALAGGFFVEPTLFADCDASLRIVREEIFGPVLTVERFASEDQAVALANGTDYGLAGAVWTGDAGRAQRVAGALRAGTVWINDYHPYVPHAEWGGYKQSGLGRELGVAGFEEYTETKHVYENGAPRPQRVFAGRR